MKQTSRATLLQAVRPEVVSREKTLQSNLKMRVSKGCTPKKLLDSPTKVGCTTLCQVMSRGKWPPEMKTE